MRVSGSLHRPDAAQEPLSRPDARAYETLSRLAARMQDALDHDANSASLDDPLLRAINDACQQLVDAIRAYLRAHAN